MEQWREKEYRGYIKAGIVAATIANVNRDPKKRPQPFTPEDFAPKKPAVYLSIEESEEALAAFTRALGGQDLRNRNGEAD